MHIWLCKKVWNTCLKNYNNIIIYITVIYAMIFFAGAVSIEFASLANATNNVVLLVRIISATWSAMFKYFWEINRALLSYITYFEEFKYYKSNLSWLINCLNNNKFNWQCVCLTSYGYIDHFYSVCVFAVYGIFDHQMVRLPPSIVITLVSGISLAPAF